MAPLSPGTQSGPSQAVYSFEDAEAGVRAARAGDTRAVRACLGEIVPGYAAETAGAPQDVPSDVIAAMPMAPIARQMGVSA